MKNLKNQNILITGAGRGIGRLMALNFASHGSHLVLLDIDGEAIEKVAAQVRQSNVATWCYRCDVSDREMIYAVADKIKAEVGKIDILVNNAGIVTGKAFLDCTDTEVQRTMDINIMAHFWMLRAFLPPMIDTDHGHIVSIASAAGWVGTNSLADYCASKFATVGLDESIRMELRKKNIQGVKTTLVCPFYIDTGMFAGVKTRFPRLLPILNEDKVARKIVQAVKKDRAVLKMPWIVYTVPMLRLLPVKMFDWVADFLGVSSTMDEFVGRKN